MTITPVRWPELGDALALLYAPGTADVPGRLDHAFRLISRGELNPDDLLVARSDGRVVGAVLCQPLPGAIAVIWPPGAVGDDSATQDALVAAALRHVAGTKVVQAFLPPEESARAASLLRAGFRQVARVWQMRRNSETATSAGGRSAVAPLNETVALVPYPACDPSEFEQVLVRCHDDSLDCPELHGVRTPAELLAGYRDCAPDPAQWWLARRDGNGIGVLLLSSPELVFVGVVPERRAQGIGRMLVEAARDFAPDLNVTVDTRNFPAVQLYQSVGFVTTGVRDVFIASPHTSAGAIGSIRPLL